MKDLTLWDAIAFGVKLGVAFVAGKLTITVMDGVIDGVVTGLHELREDAAAAAEAENES